MNKKIFISYSWTTPAHEQWVLELAQRLVSDGIQVVLDKWDLKPGHDKYAFMEQMVHAEDVDKVLMILDAKYAQKANGRAGGVGTETVIISPEVYKSTMQTKFIPVVAEMDEEGNPPLPIYLSGKIFIDLSEQERYEAGYEQLLRDVYQRPATARPKLGTPPAYLFEDSPISGKTGILLRGFEQKVDRHPTRINSLVGDFLDEFLENLKEFNMVLPSRAYTEVGKVVYDTLAQLLPLRDDYIGFLQKVIKSGESYERSAFSQFFERMTELMLLDDKSISGVENDHLNFFRHEMFIFSVAIAIKKEDYMLLDELINANYFIRDRYERNSGPVRFDTFRSHSDSLDRYYTELNQQRYFSVTAHVMIQRIPTEINKEEFGQADLLCYYCSKSRNGRWFPITYVYLSEYGGYFPFFSKMVSKRHLKKVLGIFEVAGATELIEKFNAIDKEDERGYSGSFRSVQKVSEWVKIEDIGSLR
ncbi:MAG: TIR domain-containing protein [Pedobacter sp.]|nr:MAG: TIR domain-containing protein [Pedobacter sp.]